LEYIDGHFQLSVSEQSMFMKMYLSEEEYHKHYGYIPECERIVYNSYSEIPTGIGDIERKILSYRQSAFRELADIIIKTIYSLKNNGRMRYLYET